MINLIVAVFDFALVDSGGSRVLAGVTGLRQATTWRAEDRNHGLAAAEADRLGHKNPTLPV